MRSVLLFACALALAAALPACSRGENNETKAAPAAETAIADPALVIRALYDRYVTPPADYPALEQEPWTQSLRAELAAMMERSQALNEPILNFDPFTGAQDGAVADLAVTTDAVAEGSHAVTRARFTLDGRPREVIYDLRWESDSWRIDNVRTACWDLRQIAGAANEAAIAIADAPECR